jgi:hypothetical protein
MVVLTPVNATPVNLSITSNNVRCGISSATQGLPLEVSTCCRIPFENDSCYESVDCMHTEVSTGVRHVCMYILCVICCLCVWVYIMCARVCIRVAIHVCDRVHACVPSLNNTVLNFSLHTQACKATQRLRQIMNKLLLGETVRLSPSRDI